MKIILAKDVLAVAHSGPMSRQQAAESLTALYEQKVNKLQEQKALSDRMNDLLTRHGGLNDNSKMIRKNLSAAIAVAKQPGYFEYYQPSADIKDVEETKALNSLVRSLGKVHRELEQINNEISHHQEHSAMTQTATTLEPNIGSLSQWFETYGRPENTACLEERMTSFQHSPKIYGGTSHHRAFKSQASTMKKGRITK
jgi:DNA-binding transcriptional regulator GbsR (MarR family)